MTHYTKVLAENKVVENTAVAIVTKVGLAMAVVALVTTLMATSVVATIVDATALWTWQDLVIRGISVVRRGHWSLTS